MSSLLAQLPSSAEVQLLPLGLRILVAIAIFYLGRLIARQLARALERVLDSSDIDASLRKFLCDVAYATMLIVVAIAALDAIGVETTAVIAVLGAAGLAIGLALQKSLSNLAAGVMLIVLRPYRVDDHVTIGKHTGRVDSIRVFHTTLITADNRQITIPNGEMIAQPLENLTARGHRRVDLVVRVSEAGDLQPIKELLSQIAAGDARVLTAPPPAIEVAEVSDTSVTLMVRPWVLEADSAAVAAATMERLRDELSRKELRFTVARG